MNAMSVNRLRLGFNVDHVATLRNARGEAYPDPIEAARIAVAAGADGITAHLREDRRHMRDSDMQRLRAEIMAPLNFEMGATEEMVAIALAVRPHACCLVPERRQELTTEGGLDVAGNVGPLSESVARLTEAGIRVSLFVDPVAAQLDAALAVGAPVVELHTGPYAHATESTTRGAELARLKTAAAHAERIGLECHAGHGLTFANVGAVAAIPTLKELNIGHFLVSQAVFDGLPATIARMRLLMDAARST